LTDHQQTAPGRPCPRAAERGRRLDAFYITARAEADFNTRIVDFEHFALEALGYVRGG
jgi:hypothetical protein